MNLHTKSGVALAVSLIVAVVGLVLLAFAGRSSTDLGIALILLGVVAAVIVKVVQALGASRSGRS